MVKMEGFMLHVLYHNELKKKKCRMEKNNNLLSPALIMSRFFSSRITVSKVGKSHI